MWCDTPAVNLNHRGTGGSTVHSINTEIRATVASLTWDTQLIVCDITTYLLGSQITTGSQICSFERARGRSRNEGWRNWPSGVLLTWTEVSSACRGPGTRSPIRPSLWALPPVTGVVLYVCRSTVKLRVLGAPARKSHPKFYSQNLVQFFVVFLHIFHFFDQVTIFSQWKGKTNHFELNFPFPNVRDPKKLVFGSNTCTMCSFSGLISEKSSFFRSENASQWWCVLEGQFPSYQSHSYIWCPKLVQKIASWSLRWFEKPECKRPKHSDLNTAT